MPSITREALEDVSQEASDNLATAQRAEERIRRFDAILDKIARAAQGLPLRDDGRVSGHLQGSTWYPLPGSCVHDRPSVEERQEAEQRAQAERLVELERRLAAVLAVATFAKEHKA